MCVCVWLCEAGHGPDMAGRLALVGVCVSEATGSLQARKCNHAEQLCQNSSPSNQGAGMRERERERRGGKERGEKRERRRKRRGEGGRKRERKRESGRGIGESGIMESYVTPPEHRPVTHNTDQSSPPSN